jgi:hypothetical protein
LTTRFDQGPEHGPEDPLAVILRSAPEYLGPPPGRYEAIRRAAARRRLLRAAAGAGASVVVAVLVALPLRLTASEAPASPTVPLAPPPASGPAQRHAPSEPPTTPASPTPSASPLRVSPTPTGGPQDGGSRHPSSSAVPPREPSATRTSARSEPSAGRTGAPASPDSRTRR